jgi:hypothetical protein
MVMEYFYDLFPFFWHVYFPTMCSSFLCSFLSLL